MNLFTEKPAPAALEKVRLVQSWTRELLQLDDDISVSVSQLRCHEPDCPPIETVIAVMTQPVQTFKIHCSLDDLEYERVREEVVVS